jgi:hypothetical protein
MTSAARQSQANRSEFQGAATRITAGKLGRMTTIQNRTTKKYSWRLRNELPFASKKAFTTKGTKNSKSLLYFRKDNGGWNALSAQGSQLFLGNGEMLFNHSAQGAQVAIALCLQGFARVLHR